MRPEHHRTNYSRTKGLAELDALAADGDKGMRTAAVRPAYILSPTTLAQVVGQVDVGACRLVMGSGRNLTDFVGIQAAVRAHLLCMAALVSEDAFRVGKVAGKAFFITSEAPRNLFLAVRLVAAAMDHKGWRASPWRLPEAALWLLHYLFAWVFFFIKMPVPLKPGVINGYCQDTFYASDAAREAFGYDVNELPLEKAIVDAVVERRLLGGESVARGEVKAMQARMDEARAIHPWK